MLLPSVHMTAHMNTVVSASRPMSPAHKHKGTSVDEPSSVTRRSSMALEGITKRVE